MKRTVAFLSPASVPTSSQGGVSKSLKLPVRKSKCPNAFIIATCPLLRTSSAGRRTPTINCRRGFPDLHYATFSTLAEVNLQGAENLREPATSFDSAETEQEIFQRIKQLIESGTSLRVDYLADYQECKSRQLLPELTQLILRPPQDGVAHPFSHIMSFFLRVDQPLDAIKVFNIMVSLGLRPGLYNFNSLISALGRIGKINIALEVLHQMKKEGVMPNKVTIATLTSVMVKAYLSSSSGDKQKVQEQLVSARAALEEMRVAWEREEMLNQGRVNQKQAEAFARQLGGAGGEGAANKVPYVEMQPRSQYLAAIYNALMSVHSLMGDVDSALKMLELLKKQKMTVEITGLNMVMRACVKKGMREKAVSLYEQEMRKGEEIPPTLATYNILLRQYSDLGQVDQAWAILARMRKRNLAVRRYATNALIAACIKGGQNDRALSVFEMMKKAEDPTGSPSTWTYNMIIKSCFAASRDEIQLKRAFVLYNELKDNYLNSPEEEQQQLLSQIQAGSLSPKSPSVPNRVTFHLLLNLCAKAVQPELAFSLLREMKSIFGLAPDHITYNILINACSRAKDVPRAFSLREDMKRDGLEPDAITLSTLLTACVRVGDVKKAFEVYEEIDHSGLSPATYETRMLGYAKLGDMQKAMALKEEMTSKGVPPSQYGYNNLIHACGRTGDLSKAFDLFNEMKGQGIMPNAITYNILMHECADQGSLPNALGLYKQMRNEGIKPNHVTATTLIHALCRAGEVTKALAFLKEMKEEGASVSSYTLNTLLDACARRGLMETAFSLFDEMKKEDVMPELAIFNTLLAGCARKMWEERAFALLEEMKACGLQPDKSSYTHLINACARNGNTERAFGVFREMKACGIPPSFLNYAALIDSCAHMGMVDDAFTLFQEMKQEYELKPDVSIYSGLVDVCVRGGELDRAFIVVEEMKKEGHKPDVVLFNSLLGGCVRKGWEEKAFALLGEMAKEGIEPDVVTFMTLIHRHAGEGLVEKAETILTDMLGQGVQPDKAFYTSLIKASRKVGKYNKQVKRWQGELKKLEDAKMA